MLRDDLRRALSDAKPALSRTGVAHLAVFGSQARATAGSSSDLDILVDVVDGAKFSLLDLVGVERLLTTATGIKVNAVMRRSLDAAFKARIARDIVEIF
jgi:predicted nucleotidyltransferase